MTKTMMRALIGLTLLLLVACRGDTVTQVVCDPGYLLNDDQTRCELEIPTTSCDPDAERSIASECATANRGCVKPGVDVDAECGTCLTGFKQDDGDCVATVTCEQLDCASDNRDCQEANGNFDAQCTNCVDPFILADGACVRVTCQRNVPGTMFDTCEGLNRGCMETGDGAVCGGCEPFYTEGDDQTCRQLLKCKELECGNVNRFCVERTETEDATCGACTSAFDDVDGVCQRKPPVASCDAVVEGGTMTQAEICAVDHRDCAVEDNQAICTDCSEGYTGGEDGQVCLMIRSCDDLGCTAQHRECDEGAAAFCGRCEIGYAEDPETEECRPVVTCDELNCDAIGVSCVAPEEGDPNYRRINAYCEVNCGPNAIYNGRQCALCPPCDGEGEDGRSRHPTASGYCICKTLPNYYYSTSADIGTYDCDADLDGWVRESARISLTANDPVLRASANCSLRSINQIILENEYGESKTVELDRPVPLYESVRNDDDGLLRATWLSYGLANYESGRLVAANLNRFTKACHALNVDYNDNGAPDYSEWKGMPLSPSLLREQKVFNEYSYFLELHHGVYEANGSSSGAYRIKERKRAGDPGNLDYVDLAPDDEGHRYWRECRVLPDRGWDDQEADPISMDLAGFEDAEGAFRGMNLHSMFKCLSITATPDDDIPTQMSASQARAYENGLTVCKPRYQLEPTDTNPLDVKFDCEPIEVSAAEERVVWGVTPYRQYSTDDEYVRGCVNECVFGGDSWRSNEGCGEGNPNFEDVLCFEKTYNYGQFERCQAWEVCDGLDNDGDEINVADRDVVDGSGIDESLGTTNGLTRDCDTGLLGVCAEGIKLCIPGLDSNTMPFAGCVPKLLVEKRDPTATVISDPALAFCNNTGANDDYCLNQYLCPGDPALVATEHPIKKMISCAPAPNNSKRLNEICDGIDNDCDGRIDEGPIYDEFTNTVLITEDANGNQDGTACVYSGDGNVFGKCAIGKWACAPEMLSLDSSGDVTPAQLVCNQVHTGITPDLAGQPERGDSACNGIDDDCDGLVDEAGSDNIIATTPAGAAQCFAPFRRFHHDADGDGFGDDDLLACACTPEQGLAAMTEHFAQALNFDNFNIQGGQLLPDGFFGDWGLDFQGYNAPTETRNHTGRSLRSRAIGSNGRSFLGYSAYFGSPQRISFRFRTSSENSHDSLVFRVNGTERGRWSGDDRGWELAEFSVSPGNAFLTWSYEKDGSASRGSDAVWIDNVRLISSPRITQRSGDCCDRSRDVKPSNSAGYYETETVCGEDQGLNSTFDYNCNGVHDQRYPIADTRTQKIRLYPRPRFREIDLWIFGTWYVAIPPPSDLSGYCGQLREDYPGGWCRQIWQSPAPPACGERGAQIWVFEYNEVYFSLPFPPQNYTQSCR